MPSAPFVVPPLLLLVLLIVSAVAKIRDPSDTASVFGKLKLPLVLLRLQAPRILPYAELVLAAAVLVLPGAWYVAATTAMLVLFVAYFVVIFRALRLPYPIMCGCFGRLGLGTVTRQTLARNGLLMALAAVAWADSWRGAGLSARLLHLGSDWWWLAGVLLAIATTVLTVRESPTPDWPPHLVDSDAYDARPIPYALLDGPDGPGSVWRLSDAAARLLVFLTPHGPTTDEIAARVPTWQEQLVPVRVHLVAHGEWSQLSASRPELAALLLGDPDGQTRVRLDVPSTPGAVLLGTDRLLAGGPAIGMEEIEELVTAAAEAIRVSMVDPQTEPAQ